MYKKTVLVGHCSRKVVWGRMSGHYNRRGTDSKNKSGRTARVNNKEGTANGKGDVTVLLTKEFDKNKGNWVVMGGEDQRGTMENLDSQKKSDSKRRAGKERGGWNVSAVCRHRDYLATWEGGLKQGKKGDRQDDGFKAYRVVGRKKALTRPEIGRTVEDAGF